MNSCASAARRGLDFGRCRVGPAERDVCGDRVGEEERVLEHHADAASQRLQRGVAHVDAVDRHRARVHVVEPGQQQSDGRLSRARPAHERDRLARRDVQGEIAQHRLCRRVAEGHVVERDRAALDVQLARIGMILDERGRIEQVVDALGPGSGELADGEDRGELSHGRRDQQHVRRECEERSVGDVVVQREPPAEREHRDLAEGRNGLHRGLEPGLDVHQAYARREHRLRPIGQALELAGLLTEALHDPHSGDVLLDDVGDVARLLLRVPARGEDRSSQLHGRDEQQRSDRQHHERQRYRQHEHHGQRDDEQQHVRHTDREELQEALDQCDVGGRAAHELTGRHLVVAGEVEPLQLPEDRGSQVVLHVERDAPAPEPAVVGEDERQHAHDDHQCQPGRQRLVVVGDDVVDDDLLYRREQRLDELTADRDPERDVRVLLVRLHVADQATNPALLLHLVRLHLGTS